MALSGLIFWLNYGFRSKTFERMQQFHSNITEATVQPAALMTGY